MFVLWHLNLLYITDKVKKKDANDAEAICEAVTRPKTRFVSIKSEEQQALVSSPEASIEKCHLPLYAARLQQVYYRVVLILEPCKNN